MASLNATISRITESERFPKSLSEWVLPAAATATVLFGANLVFKNTRSRSDRPPVVSSWVPWVGSNWAIETDPDAFFEKVGAEHPEGIYTVKTVGWTFHYVTSAPLINQIYRQPKVFSISAPQKMWGKNCFGFPQKFYEGFMQLAPDQHRGLATKNVLGFMETFQSHLSSTVKDMVLSTEPVSLEDFAIQLAYKTTSAAYFGPTYPVETLWTDWKPFDDMVWKVALGYPPALVKDYDRSREKVIEKLARYVEASPPHQAADMLASQLELGKGLGWDSNDLGRLIVGNWWPLMASVPWSSLMLLVLQLQRPEGFKPIIAELDAAGSAFEAANPDLKGPYTDHLTAFFESNPPVPLLNSTYAETLRYTSDSYSMRGVMVDETTLGGYTFKKDETLICRTRGVHLDENEYENPGEFVPTRYMAADGEGKGLEGSMKWMPYGGGHALCPGRYFAAYHVKILVTTLIKSFNFEIDRKASNLPITLSNIHRGFGVRRPKGDLQVKITRA